jgi:hypothetical protein
LAALGGLRNAANLVVSGRVRAQSRDSIIHLRELTQSLRDALPGSRSRCDRLAIRDVDELIRWKSSNPLDI